MKYLVDRTASVCRTLWMTLFPLLTFSCAIADTKINFKEFERVPKLEYFEISKSCKLKKQYKFGFNSDGDLRVTSANGGRGGFSSILAMKSVEVVVPEGDQLIQEFGDGWIVSFDAGEFGQSTWWYDSSLKAKRKLLDDAIKYFHIRDEKLLGFSSFSHMFESRGKLFEFSLSEKNVSAKEIFELNIAPRSFYWDKRNNSWLVATYGKLVRVNDKGEMKGLSDSSDWGRFGLNTITMSGETIALGLKHGVVILSNEGSKYRQDWWVYRNCLKVVEQETNRKLI